MSHFVLTVVGTDRPGIVAEVSAPFAGFGWNIEDSAMTILRGEFAMMLVVDTPAGTEAADIEAALAGLAQKWELTVTVRPIADSPPPRPGEGTSTCTISVHGADRTGIVNSISGLMFTHGVNITDLSTRVIGDSEGDGQVYVMTIEVDVPPTLAVDDLRAMLEQTAAGLGVTAKLHEPDADIL